MLLLGSFPLIINKCLIVILKRACDFAIINERNTEGLNHQRNDVTSEPKILRAFRSMESGKVGII